MSRPNPIPDATRLQQAVLIDEICTRFEDCFRNHQSPQIERFLSEVPPELHLATLGELLAVEFELRRTRGESIDLAAWKQRFPGHETVVEEAFAPAAGNDFEEWLTSRLQEVGWRMPAFPERDPGESAREEPPRPPSCDAPGLDNAPLPLRFTPRKVLGQGGFGTVYLAHDQHHNRLVAIKCIRADRARDTANRDALRREAHLAARLSHPGIVEIHELLEDDQSLLIVEEYLPGGDLRSRVVPGGLPFGQVADWMIAIADAVSFAHQHDLFHRDIKPANILLDEVDRPRVADFGLALLEEQLLDPKLSGRRSGTVAYMSPEQARGESHRLDGRSDTWSRGVVLYELLTGRCPFRGTTDQILDQIRTKSPRPLRELRPELPPEIERICLKCLSRRQADRYSTVSDLAADLRALRAKGSSSENTDRSCPLHTSVVPKGLRAFDAHDREFFLDLLPGPRDRDGLPECIRSWKQRIESTQSDRTAAIGVVHGPSGCGKSSLVRSGLIPSLGPGVLPIVVEATPDDTVRTLQATLRLRLPWISPTATLADSLAALRHGTISTGGRKLLLVIDQFEQWLNTWTSSSSQELVDALRQCDGRNLQGLLLVRDDFWPPLLRLMEQLEISLQPGFNSASVALFDREHARRVLILFGQAFQSLPARLAELTEEHHRFLDAAITALADRDKIICVRLALFAEWMKTRSWNVTTLETVGGPQGLAMAFLEETLAPDSVPASRRRHAAGAQRLLQALLPPAGSQIRGTSLSPGELRDRAGYAADSRGFSELLQWLDGDLRLITPCSHDGQHSVESVSVPAAGSAAVGGYQLTHDYLVPAIREWIRSRELSTSVGRVRNLLAERSALWESHPLDRFLPTVWEHLTIRLHIAGPNRSLQEQRFLARAMQVHLRRGLWMAMFLLGGFLLSWSAWQRQQAATLDTRARNLVNLLMEAEPERWPSLLNQLGSPALQSRAGKALAEVAATTTSRDDRSTGSRPGFQSGAIQHRLARLALLDDRAELGSLTESLLHADPAVMAVSRPILVPHLRPENWEVVWSRALSDRADTDEPRDAHPGAVSVQAAALLAGKPGDDARWNDLAPSVLRQLAKLDASDVVPWRALLQPIRHQLAPVCLSLFRDPAQTDSQHRFTLECLADFARDNSTLIGEALLESDPESFGRLIPVARQHKAGLIRLMRKELEIPIPGIGEWNDPTPDAGWQAVSDDTRHEIEAAQGQLFDSCAYCIALPREKLAAVNLSLEQSGYRLYQYERQTLTGDNTVTAVWNRDGGHSTLLQDLSFDEVVVESRRQRSLGREIAAFEAQEDERFTLLATDPGAWGRNHRSSIGPIGLLEPGVDNFLVGKSWHCRVYRYQSPEPITGVGLSSPTLESPLLDSGFMSLQQALRSVADRWGSKSRNVRLVAETTFETPAVELLVEAMLVQGLRVTLDGKAIDGLERRDDSATGSITVPITLTGGKHHLRVEQQWNEIDTRSTFVMGRRKFQFIPSSRLMYPEWMQESIVPFDVEQPVQQWIPVFDGASVFWSGNPTAARELRALVDSGFRPFRIARQNRNRREGLFVDLCRPRPRASVVDRHSQRRARAVLSLLELDQEPARQVELIRTQLRPQAHPLVTPGDDPSARTEVMLHLATYPWSSSGAWNLLQPGPTGNMVPEVRQQLWLALGRSGDTMSESQKQSWINRLDIAGQWRSDPDAGVHGALDWLLRHWNQSPSQIDDHSTFDPQKHVPPSGARPTWWINSQGIGLTSFPTGTFSMGGNDVQSIFGILRMRRSQTIDRPFALATMTLTYPQLDRFLRTGDGLTQTWKRTIPYSARMTWHDAVRYLNWLSDQEGLQRCFEFDERGDVIVPADWLDRNGYRFPTNAEWEYAARSGMGTDWFHGSTPTRLAEYAWTAQSSADWARNVVGQKLPNDAGLFDVLGTEDEWLHDAFNPHPPPHPVPEREVVGTGHQRLVRNSMGAAWHSLRLHTWKSQATTAFASLRLARTLSVPGDGRATVAIPKSSQPSSTTAVSERISH